ncbi:hypothetical protein BEP19_04535 [Ammoniphilus oxalaticus]|uniref:DUF3892 domain-containing protein n=1 Tax=Ammoniphilus oxalaticus TaxID=66863 RepID=A0A419SM01_9BACL|nr:DUF3892 domain-containing protein [Ammoniphilus oxalaticus]RKD25091.1 hypothetical protein BEP19_04535 [Ammoniphilus oxalaticus]
MNYKLVAVRKDAEGNITHFLTDRDTVITLSEAIALVENDQINSITSLKADGTWLIDEYGQYEQGQNLADLPGF